MMDLIHKILYTGIGFAALTEQKAKEIVEELEQRGEVTGEEGKRLAQDLIDRARAHKEHLQQSVHEEVNKIAAKCGWVSKQDVEELQRRIETLEAQVASGMPSGQAPASEDSL